MTFRKNRVFGYCERCGTHLRPGEGRLEYCTEDSGCLKHHDEGGYHLYCADTASCDSRRAEAARAAAGKRAAEAELAAKEEEWRAEVARLTAGLESTLYGPPLYMNRLSGTELVATAPEGIRSSATKHLIDEVRRVNGDLVTIDRHRWIVTYWGIPERIQQLRLTWARGHGITLERAREALSSGSQYMSEDSRLMYEAVLRNVGETP